MNDVFDYYRFMAIALFGPFFLAHELRSTPPFPDPVAAFGSLVGTVIWIAVAIYLAFNGVPI